jgi:HemY protein
LEAVKLEPTLVPAAALAGRLLGEAGDMRRAARIVEAAWKANPHPDLADAFAHLQPGDSARDQLRRVETLAEKTPGNIEGALAVARSALDAQEFAIARRALLPLSIVPTQRVAMLMAELEEREHGDEGRAREWMTRAVHARRDPAWTADGIVSDRWMPVSPVTGRLDAFQWRDPIAEVDADGAVIEHDREPRPVVPPPPAPRTREIRTQEARPPESLPAAPPPPASPGRGIARTAAATAVPIAPVIPLVHVPDDPGPDAPPHLEPETETSPEPQSEAWRKLRGLFK